MIKNCAKELKKMTKIIDYEDLGIKAEPFVAP